MLAQNTFSQINGAFHTVVDLLGVSADYKCIKDPTRNKTKLTVGFSGGAGDSTLVQSLGVESKTITCKVEDFTAPPEKFDQFLINGQTFVLDSVHLIHLNGTVIGYKCKSKGK